MSDIELISFILKGFAAFGLSMMLFALLPKTPARRFLAFSERNQMRSILNKVILCAAMLCVSELCAMTPGEEVMNILGCKEPNRISWLVPRHKLKMLPSKLDIGSIHYKIWCYKDGAYTWEEDVPKTKNFGYISMDLAPDCSHVMKFAFEVYARASCADVATISRGTIVEQKNKYVIIYKGDTWCVIVRDNVVIRVTAHQKDANKIAEAIYEYQFGE